MDGLKCVIKKDIKEILRTGKMALFLILAFGIAFMIFGFTVLFSNIPDSLTTELPGLDIESLESINMRTDKELTKIYEKYEFDSWIIPIE